MEKAIDRFLDCTARWTPRWFNKPKFHIIRHLPDHIRRFGPSILFATEAFESFNAIIRTKSVHSNRQAPSRDLAYAFARGNRIRHLLSGGYFLDSESEVTHSNINSVVHSGQIRQSQILNSKVTAWTIIGRHAEAIIAPSTNNKNSVIRRFLGMSDALVVPIPGMFWHLLHSLLLY
jgi:hypothetical protein